MFLLPVSLIPVTFRVPDGRDELLLAESTPDSAWLRVEAVRRLAPTATGSVSWEELPYADVDPALLALRRQLHGDHLRAEIQCSSCRAWGDIALSISQYLEAHLPLKVRDVRMTDDGWWSGRGVRLRIPTTEDVLEESARAGRPEAAAQALEDRCLPEGSRRGYGILNRLAPPLSGAIQGRCPACGVAVKSWFDAGGFVLAELKQRALRIFDQVHQLASAYGWTEEAILSLPASRRTYYSERIQEGSRA